MRRGRGLDRLLDVLGAALRDVREDVALAVRLTASNVSPGWTSLPPMIIGMEIRSLSISLEPGWSAARSGVPGA